MKTKVSLLITLIISFLGISSTHIYAYSCESDDLFFVVNIQKNDIQASSLLCEFGATQYFQKNSIQKIKVGDFIIYDHDTERIFLPVASHKNTYFTKIGNFIKEIQSSPKLQEEMVFELGNNFQNHQNIFSQGLQKYLLSPAQNLQIQEIIAQHPYTFFKNTHGKRLLMDGEVISREEWGANEAYANPEYFMAGCEDGSCQGGGPTAPNQLVQNYLKYFNHQDARDVIIKTFDDGRIPIKYYPVDRIVVHHTASRYIATKQEALEYMQSLHKYHSLTLRWSDIGYHYLIDGEGNIYEGRAGGKYAVGAHVATHNYGTVGISLMTDSYISDEMLESMKRLIVYLGQEYNIDLTQETTIRSKDLTGWTTGWALVAHKELDARKPYDPEIIMDVFREQVAKESQKLSQ